MKKNQGQTKARAKRKPKSAEVTNNELDQMPERSVRHEYMDLITRMEIHSLATAAESGDQNAVDALHSIAVKAANTLNALPLSVKQATAKTTEWWPVNLSWVPSWNRANVLNLPTELGLGNSVSSVVDFEAVLKRGAPLPNILGAYLVAHVEECRRFGMLLRRVRIAATQDSQRELSSDGQRLLTLAFNQVRLLTSALAAFMNHELPKLTQDRFDAEMVWTVNRAEAAMKLPPLLESHQSRLDWFGFAMELVEEISGKAYDKPEFGLIGMNRKDKLSGAAQVRAGIRQGIQEGFFSVIRNVSPKGFVVVN